MSDKRASVKFFCIRAIIMLACLSLFAGTAAAADSMKDVPPGHWAYQAVQQMISKGYLPTYNDGTFKGDNPADRYTLANVVAKLLKELDKGNVKASDQDLLTIRTLSVEFREDLVAQGVRIDEFDKRLKTLESLKMDGAKSDIAGLKSDMNSVKSDAAGLKSDISGLKSEIVTLKTDTSSLKGIVNSKASVADSLKADMTSADMKLSERIAQQELKIKELSASIGQNGSQADYQALKKEYDTYKKNTQVELSILKAGVIAAVLLALIH